MTTKTNNSWLVPALLLTFGALSVVSGALQLNMIQQGPPADGAPNDSMQYFETPIPIVLHIVSGIIFYT